MPTREEIVKALRGEQELVCFEPLSGKTCDPVYLTDMNRNSYILYGDAADLIEQQAKEIERLTESLLLANVNFEHAKRERDAAIADIEKLMREVGLQCWEACEFCGMLYDYDECIRNAPHKGQCKTKWRGAGSKNNVN